ncbi:MAG: class I SAM-dependent methyltransferase [Dehalococcoidia bacterium]|nr:class I SAM-dependent methyltransferase [Dehalococcoidia bacterium]MDH4366597.1 class I SAM-dependent methyltransferase [Dehalococcoidia bacterium]
MTGNTERIAERAIVEEGTHASTLYQHIARYVFARQFVRGKAVLDIACGTGYGASYLLNKGAKTVVGGDNSEEAIEYARLHYQKDRLSFLRCDAQQMLFRDWSFDVIVSFETIEHLRRYEDFLEGCRRALKDDGVFICSTPNRDGRFGYENPTHFREFAPEEFRELIATYFAHVDLYGQGFLKRRDMIKGESIRRLSPIIRFIPRPVKGFLKRLIQPEQCLFTSLAEACPNFAGGHDEILEQRYLPLPLAQGSTACRGMIAVARKQDG